MRTIRILYSVTFIFIVAVLISCKSDDDDAVPEEPTYFIRFKVNNVPVEFTSVDGSFTGEINQVFDDGKLGDLLGGVAKAGEGEKNSILIHTTKEQDYPIGTVLTHYETTQPNHQQIEELLITYDDDSGQKYWNLLAGGFTNPDLIDDAKLVYTNVTNDFSFGTFSGTLYSTEDNETVMVMTE